MGNSNGKKWIMPSTGAKSSIHGTSGTLTRVRGKKEKYELLGIAHFHRPEKNSQSDYAYFGHHYTHAFYTISSNPPYKLLHLSNEFIFPSFHYPDDGEIIQFAAGFDVVLHGLKVVISYGINDCESAIVDLPLRDVNNLLIEVESDVNVIHHMKALNITNLRRF